MSSKGCLVVVKEGDDERYHDIVTAHATRKLRKVADLSRMTISEVHGMIETSLTDGVETSKDVADETESSRRVSVSVRGGKEPTSAATVFTDEPRVAFDAALACDAHTSTPLIDWEDKQAICAVDVDYHAEQRRARPWLSSFVATIEPVPAYRWITHGDGLRLIYFACDGFDADELASVAAANVRRRDTGCTVELKSVTWHPRHPRGKQRCSDVEACEQTTNVESLRSYMAATVDDDAVADWLESNNYERGGKYEHGRCPIEPHIQSHGEPVHVGDVAIYCHKCEANGVKFGSRRPGVFPYSSLVASGTPSVVANAVRNLVHWEHARHVFDVVVGLNDAIAATTYRTLLKIEHGVNDPRIDAVFAAGRDVIRLDGRWTTADTLSTYGKDIDAILAKLPATQYVSDDGEVKVDREIVTRFKQPVNLASFGYVPIKPVRGSLIHGVYIDTDVAESIPVVVPSKDLRPASRAMYRPRYIPRKDRIPYNDAWATLETVFPECPRQYVELLVAAKGVVEGDIGLTPYLLVTGPSSAAKSASVSLAAAICGDHNSEVEYTPDAIRFRQAILQSLDEGTFVTFNEFLKRAATRRVSAREALDVVLTLTPDSKSHVMYVGPVAMGSSPVFVFTDINVPQSVADDAQLSRRFIFVKLTRRLEWKPSLITSGVRQVRRLRYTSKDYSDACDAILSHVVDEHFTEPTPLDVIAKRLGYSTLEESTEFEDNVEPLRKLFTETCRAPAIRDGETEKRRWPGRGYKLIQRDEVSPLAEAWGSVCDANWTTSRRVHERDWSLLLSVDDPVTVDVSSHGNSTLAIRFRVGPLRRPIKVNEEITDPDTPF